MVLEHEVAARLSVCRFFLFHVPHQPAEIAGVERKSVYAWLGGGAVKPHNQERLEKIYNLLNEGKLTNLRHLYRFWSRNIIGNQSLGLLFEEKILDDEKLTSAWGSKLYRLSFTLNDKALKKGACAFEFVAP